MNTEQALITVSVLMITYAHEKYIKQAIEGVLMQENDFDIELIIADDKSPDKTEKIVENLIKNHKNGHWIKYTKHKKNKGIQPNFIWAYQQCSGKYIAICEGDDYWIDPLKLQKQIDFLERNKEYAVCCHNAQIIDEKGVLIQDKKIPYLSKDKIFTELEMKKCIPMLTLTLVLRNFKGFNDQIIKSNNVINGDMFTISLLGMYGKGFYMENIKPAKYRVHSGGVWSSKKHNPLFVFKSQINLYSALRDLHNEEIELVDHFEERISNCHQNLLANMDKLTFKEMFYSNFKYIKRNYSKPLKCIYNLIKYNGKYIWFSVLKK